MILYNILIILFLTGLNGLLAMSEIAILSSRRGLLEQMAAGGNRGAKAALGLLEEPSRFLSTVQIGITLVGIFAGAFSGATIGKHLAVLLNRIPGIPPHGEALGIGITVVAITYLSLVIGELVPKRIALTRPEGIAAFMAGPMKGLSILAAPMVWALHISTETMLRLLQLSELRRAPVTEDEVKTMIAEGTQAGVFVPQEQEMIEGVLRLADRPLRVIMTPRSEIVWVDITADRDAVLTVVDSHRISRLLVCNESLDHPVGAVHVRDLLPEVFREGALDLNRIMTPLLVVSERASALTLLSLFKREQLHMGVVVDEHGSTEGIVTPTDLLESIAGDLPERGEDDTPRLVQREDGSWLVDGTLPTDDVAATTGVDLGPEVKTMAGFILHHLESIPDPGVNFRYGNARFEILDMDGNRVDKILMEIFDPAPEEDP